jgi:hypothetical protein
MTIPMNFGNSTTYGIEGIATVFPTTFWSLNGSFSLYKQRIDGSNVSADISNNLLSWYGKIISNFTLREDFKLQLIANYNSPVATPQGSRIAVYFMDMGMQLKTLGGRGAIGIVVTDVFNTQKSGLTAYASDFAYNRKFKVDTRALLITLAITFKAKFDDELLENKFSND